MPEHFRIVGPATCRNCGSPIVQIITTDGVGWYHPLPDKADGTRHVRESCNASGLGIPCAEPQVSP